MDTEFNVYRNGEKITSQPVSTGTLYNDAYTSRNAATYEVRPVVKGKETNHKNGRYTCPPMPPTGYIRIPMNKPANGVTPAGDTYTYSPNDASIGDIDGDGEYEIILKWDPSNSHDNAHDGYTGEVLIDCYRLNGEQLCVSTSERTSVPVPITHSLWSMIWTMTQGRSSNAYSRRKHRR